MLQFTWSTSFPNNVNKRDTFVTCKEKFTFNQIEKSETLSEDL